MKAVGVRITAAGGTGTLEGATGAGLKRPDEPLPTLTLRPLRRGAEYVRATKGGVIRDRAPSDGFAWEAGEACGFVPLRDIQTATVDLKLAQEKRP